MLTTPQAQAYMQQHANSNSISQQDVETLLADVRGTTFAQIVQVTPVATAAAHKAVPVRKVTVANVQLFNNIRDFNIYASAVKRSAAKLHESDPADVATFVTSETWHEHTSCYSVVEHKTKRGQFYLYAIYNRAESLLFIGNDVASKEQVAQLLTPSAAKSLLQDNSEVHNVSNNVTHSVIVRTTALANIVSIRAMGNDLQV